MSVGFADDDTVNVPSLAIFISLPVYSVVLSELYSLYVTVLSVNTSAFPFLTTASYLLLLGICAPTGDFTNAILSFLPISFTVFVTDFPPNVTLTGTSPADAVELTTRSAECESLLSVSTETPSANSSSIFHSAVPNAILPSVIFADTVICTFTLSLAGILTVSCPFILNESVSTCAD